MPRTKTAPPALKEEIVLAPEQRRAAFVEVIRAAKRRLLLSVFRCTDFAVMDALAEARQRKVEVRLLLTPRAQGWIKRLKELGAYLESMGAQVRSHADLVVKYHAKYMVADDRLALVGSANMTPKCFTTTCDFILITRAPGVVTGLEQLFETDWAAPHSSFPAGIDERLIVGPERARAQLTDLLGGARRSIQIIDHKLSDPSMLALLKAKEKSGVEVRILGAGHLGGLRPHGKLILVDGNTAALGSMALSALAMDFRREVSVVVEDPRCVRKLKAFYRLLASDSQPMSAAQAAASLRLPGRKKTGKQKR
ncbi:MAG TPA: phospholipase D-like domain-containing protein [Candidatus Acidoferrales bacterium]|nr:phospholipase D-like domain-containing protein [Candidatus Acidoferrales bacterium]